MTDYDTFQIGEVFKEVCRILPELFERKGLLILVILLFLWIKTNLRKAKFGFYRHLFGHQTLRRIEGSVVTPCNYCVPGGIRTHDLRIRNAILTIWVYLSLKDLDWENPLKSAHWIASLYNWVVFDWDLKIQIENKTVAKTVAIN